MYLSTQKFITIGAKTNGKCFYCNRPAQEVDHFISRYWWKEFQVFEYTGVVVDALENLFLACKRCNSSKGTKSPEEFIGNPFLAWERYRRANKRVGILIPSSW